MRTSYLFSEYLLKLSSQPGTILPAEDRAGHNTASPPISSVCLEWEAPSKRDPMPDDREHSEEKCSRGKGEGEMGREGFMAISAKSSGLSEQVTFNKDPSVLVSLCCQDRNTIGWEA